MKTKDIMGKKRKKMRNLLKIQGKIPFLQVVENQRPHRGLTKHTEQVINLFQVNFEN